MAYVTQQIIKTTEEWAAFDALGKAVPKDYWLFERVIDGENTYYKFKLSDGTHLFAELPYQLLNGNSARISTDGYWETFNDATQQYVKIDVKALGSDGKSAFEVWQSQPGNADKTVEQYLASLKGDPFVYSDFTPEQLEQLKGESAYQIWLTQPGNEGKTVEEFIASLKGATGAAFTYDMFTPEQLEGLKGQDGVISVDAPSDGKTYGRKNEGWAEVVFKNTLDFSSINISNPPETITSNMLLEIEKAYLNQFGNIYVDGGTLSMSIKANDVAYIIYAYCIETLQIGKGQIIAYLFGVNKETLQFGVMYSGVSIDTTGNGTKFSSDNGSYVTPPNATTTTPGYMSPEDKQKVDAALIFKDVTTVTTLTNLPPTNYSIKATLSAASPISFASTPAEGEEYMIDILNSGSADFDQPLPNADNCQSNETSVTCPAGKVTAISVRYIHSKYVFRV